MACIGLIFLSIPAQAKGTKWQLGVSGLEEGDDRFRPALFGSLDFDQYRYGFFYHKKIYGVVTEDRNLVFFGRAFGTNLFKGLNIFTGLALLHEGNSIQYPDRDLQAFNRSEDEFNLGIFYGLNWTVYEQENLFATLSWESALFPAGLAVLALVTARKEYVTLSLGVATL